MVINIKILKVLLIAAILTSLIACNGKTYNKSNDKITTDNSKIAQEMKAVLNDKVLNKWFPLCIDTLDGGYLHNFDKLWREKDNQPKFIVMQARNVWTTAQVYKLFPSRKEYKSYSEHGFEFLRDYMWDKKHGGFYTLTTRDGKPLFNNNFNSAKIAYGNAFAIYGLAAYYQISKNEDALELAKKTFYWLEKHAHDEVNGGYFQFISQDGKPYTDIYDDTPPKDQNSSIHILEAFTELYKVWNDDTLKNRLNELLILIRDTITTPKGYMRLFFTEDWKPIDFNNQKFSGRFREHQFDHVSFGHDVETAYLIMEASEALGYENDSTTIARAKIMADHSFINGWDVTTGATYDEGFYFNPDSVTIIDERTQWWSACETFNTALIMETMYPKDPLNYHYKFAKTWDYCKTYLIDSANGGWYRYGINTSPKSEFADKGDIWKGTYHIVRALINSIKRIEGK